MSRKNVFIILSPLVFLLISSALLVSIMDWWREDYFSGYGGLGWVTAWPDYAMDAATWHLPGRSIIAKSRAIKLPMAVVTSGAVGLALAYAMVAGAARSAGQSSLYGKARWQNFFGARRAGIRFSLTPPGDSIVLGIYRLFNLIKLYAHLPNEKHVALTAPTGEGKGVSFVVPNCLNWEGPLFVFSVKRDVLDACAAERERKGDKVFVFDVTEPNGYTHKWSGFGDMSDVNADNGDFYGDIQRIMFTLIPETKANNPFWDNSARMVATAIGVMLAETNALVGKSLNIGDILAAIERHDYEQYLRDLILDAEKRGKPFPQSAVFMILSWLGNKAEEATASIRSNIITAFALWHIPRIDAVTTESDFNLAKIRSQHISVFVCAHESDIRLLRPIYTLLFTQLIQFNSRVEWLKDPTHRKVRTLCMLDERWALGEMKDFDNAISFIRSAGIRICTVLQNKEQLIQSISREGMNNIFNNSGAVMIFGKTDYETAKDISAQIGTKTVEETSFSKPRFSLFGVKGHNENRKSMKRDLILPNEVSAIDRNTAIIMMKGEPPLKLERIFWYTDSKFSYMGGDAPPMPVLKVKVRRQTVAEIEA